jgi:DNA-binding PadR family transcriptional regulator
MSPRALGFITAIILRAVRDGHRHGADIMKATGEGGGTVYKVLRRLEERGLILGRWEGATVAERERRPRRRYYRLTRQGEDELSRALERYRDLAVRALGDEALGGSH